MNSLTGLIQVTRPVFKATRTSTRFHQPIVGPITSVCIMSAICTLVIVYCLSVPGRGLASPEHGLPLCTLSLPIKPSLSLNSSWVLL